ncbi:Hypothetical predicted protein, partial [Pelobates cultripes]
DAYGGDGVTGERRSSGRLNRDRGALKMAAADLARREIQDGRRMRRERYPCAPALMNVGEKPQ